MPVTINGTTGIAGVDGSAGTPAVQGSDTNTGVYFPTADTISASTGGTERMRIDSSGNVGIGTTSPLGKLDVTQSTNFSLYANHSATNGYSGVGYYENGTVKGYQVHFGSTASGGERIETWTSSASPLTFGTNNTERMRIDASGNVLIGTQSPLNSTNTIYRAGGYCLTTAVNTTSAATYHIVFNNPNGAVGSISTGASATAFNTASDYRLKEDVKPVTNAISRVMMLKPVNFAWKIDSSRVDGFIAHEAQSVVPEAVTGAKDAVDEDGKPIYQGIDQSKLVPLLTAALQEALTEISSLKARVDALETA